VASACIAGVEHSASDAERGAFAVRPASIITVAVVDALPCIVPLIVAIAPVVMLFDARRTAAACNCQRVVVEITIALVPIARVPRIACVTVSRGSKSMSLSRPSG
jgi:hypothetical protein